MQGSTWDTRPYLSKQSYVYVRDSILRLIRKRLDQGQTLATVGYNDYTNYRT